MALVFNQARETRPFVNPYGIKFNESYFEIASLDMRDGQLIAKRSTMDEYKTGKFVVSSNAPNSSSVRVCAVLWLPDYVDLSYLAELTPSDRSKEVAGQLATMDKRFVHNDIHTIVRQLNPDLFLRDGYFFGGGMVSIDLAQRILKAGLGSGYGILPRSLLIDAFSDLADKLGCNFEPINPLPYDSGCFVSGSDADRWFRQFHVPFPGSQK